MVIESPDFKINTRMLAGKMGGSVDQDGFGSGYRNLVWNGTKYDFTKKQAEAVEYMHNAGGPRHQDEILAEINSSQDKLLRVFRSRGKRHQAWGEVIKNDGKGNYWLEYCRGSSFLIVNWCQKCKFTPEFTPLQHRFTHLSIAILDSEMFINQFWRFSYEYRCFVQNQNRWWCLRE